MSPLVGQPISQASFGVSPGPVSFNAKAWSNPIRYPINRPYGRDLVAETGRQSFDRHILNRGFASPSTSIYVPGTGQPVEVLFDAAGAALYWPAPSGDFEIVLEYGSYYNANNEMIGPMIVDSTGAGVGASVYNNPNGNYTWGLLAWSYNASGPTAGWTPVSDGRHMWQSLRKSGTSYISRHSDDGATWTATSTLTSSITPAYIGVGRFYSAAGGWYRLYRLNVFSGTAPF